MNVLFVCKYNVGRSQIAEAFFNKMSKNHQATSAGTHVEGDLDEHKEGFRKVITAMKELDYDLSKIKRKQLTEQMFNEADKVVVITEKENLPAYARNSSKVVLWKIEDGKGQSYEFICKMRDDIKPLVERLAEEVG